MKLNDKNLLNMSNEEVKNIITKLAEKHGITVKGAYRDNGSAGSLVIRIEPIDDAEKLQFEDELCDVMAGWKNTEGEVIGSAAVDCPFVNVSVCNSDTGFADWKIKQGGVAWLL